MNKDVKALFVAVNNNKVICFETNLKLFTEEFIKIEPSARNYDWFYRKFKKDLRFCCKFKNQHYWFQKLNTKED